MLTTAYDKLCEEQRSSLVKRVKALSKTTGLGTQECRRQLLRGDRLERLARLRRDLSRFGNSRLTLQYLIELLEETI